ncbi:tetratricopeptide repeat protein [Methylocella sp.]|uniref:tetratricopeptide repeat protein n=1 Tax=Methylocella sp. TaxID=1978226 RepID=UPI0037838092
MSRRRRLSFALWCGCALLAPAPFALAQQDDDALQLPLSGPAYFHARDAQAAMSRGDYDAAAASAREALRQRPDAVQLRVLLVQALERAGRYGEAVEAGAGFVAAGDRNAVLLGVLAQARRRLKPAPAVVPRAAAPTSFASAADAARAADIAFARGDYDAARAAAAEAARLDPQAYSTLRDDMKAAIDAATPATDLPSYKAAAAAYDAFSRRDYAAAKTNAALAVSLDPDNSAYRALLARAEAALRRGPPAAAPPPSPAYRAAEAGYRAFRARAYRAAARDGAAAVRLDPQNRAYRALLVDALAAGGDLAGAESAADAALRALGQDAQILAARGYVRQRLGRPAGAAQDFSAALASGSGAAAERRGWTIALAGAQTAAGRPGAALETLAPLPGTPQTLLARAAR